MRFVLVCLFSMLCLPSPALAWGADGHHITGAIAEQYLSGLARAEIRAILDDESLADAATWPDEMRSDPDPFWQKTASPWHYVTLPAGTTYAAVGAPPEGDAYTALERFAAVLRNPAAGLDQKQLALRFIVHIVGDLHQPLHAGNGLDRGGNDLPVTLQGRRTNLHAVWDTDLVASDAPWNDRAVQLATAISDEDLVAWWDPDPLTWIAESATLRDSVYPTSQALGVDYLQRFRPVAELRLQQAGVRLAAYLNQLFAEARMHGAKAKSHGDVPTVTRTNVEAGTAFRCTPVRVWDGDGPLWCAEGPRLRLAGIAAREIDESCRDNQPCPAASGAAARDALVGLVGTAVGTSPQGHVMVEGPPMSCTSTGTDNHDRTTAWCVSSKGEDISCAMIANGSALMWPEYWKDHRCPKR